MTEDEINFVDDFGADVTVNFTDYMANEMKNEIDNEVIKELMKAGEPSAVDRLAAIGEPDGPAAKRVADWEKAMEQLNTISGVSNEIFKRTLRDKPNWLYAAPKVHQSILGLPRVT